MKNEKLIVSIDDFGISQKANDRALQLIEKDKVDRISIMINGLISPFESKKLLESGVKLDIHFDFKTGLTKKRKIKEGVLKRSLIFLFKYLLGFVNPPAMEMEWERQLERFRSIFGKNPDGISSHQYIHFFPSYFKCAINIGEKFSIPYVRFGEKGFIESKSNVFRILNTLRKKDLFYLASSKRNSSDYMISLDWIGSGNIKKFLADLPEGKTEIVCHPERNEEFDIIMKYF